MGKTHTIRSPTSLREVVHERLHRYSLTPREEEIVYLLLQRYTNKQIAQRCYVSEQTVKDHLKHVYGKVDIHQRTALLARLLGTVIK